LEQINFRILPTANEKRKRRKKKKRKREKKEGKIKQLVAGSRWSVGSRE